MCTCGWKPTYLLGYPWDLSLGQQKRCSKFELVHDTYFIICGKVMWYPRLMLDM
jgi:hypothetical protein